MFYGDELWNLLAKSRFDNDWKTHPKIVDVAMNFNKKFLQFQFDIKNHFFLQFWLRNCSDPTYGELLAQTLDERRENSGLTP